MNRSRFQVIDEENLPPLLPPKPAWKYSKDINEELEFLTLKFKDQYLIELHSTVFNQKAGYCVRVEYDLHLSPEDGFVLWKKSGFWSKAKYNRPATHEEYKAAPPSAIYKSNNGD